MRLEGSTVIYGGSFNPPHMGHQMACLELLEGLGAARVLVIPAAVHPFGKPLADFSHRTAMCQVMAEPFGGRVEVSEIEARLAGSGRTFDTLVHLREARPEERLALAVGADVLQETAAWYRWEEITRMVTVAVLGRQGYPTPPDNNIVALPAISSTDIRRRIAAGESIAGLVPHRVADYVRVHGLYREAVG